MDISELPEFINGKTVKSIYGVSTKTLTRWEKQEKIKTTRTPGGYRLYSRRDLEKIFKTDTDTKPKKKIIYARVSSAKQKEDLQRQIEYLQSQKPEHELIQDIGSGINFKRKGFERILEQVCDGNVQEVVVTSKDRLCRFASELMESIFKKFGSKIVVLGHNRVSDPKEELAEDLLSVATVFVARYHGMRGGENRRKRKKTDTEESDSEEESSDEGPEEEARPKSLQKARKKEKKSRKKLEVSGSTESETERDD